MRVVLLGLSITSSWGNGHATTYRGLVRELSARGHDVTFLERDVPWYARHRDAPRPPGATTRLYDSLAMLADLHTPLVREADCVVVGSYVPEGIDVGEWVLATATGITAFYDIDTPVTLAGLARGSTEYLSSALIPRYDLYLSFSGGPTLRRLEREFGAAMVRALYCSVDADRYRPAARPAPHWDLGYLGTYSDDRQPHVDTLILEPARRLPAQRFVVAGPQYPASLAWPANVERIEHLPPADHPDFYTAQRFTLNVTRADMVRAGWSPSVRLFEAAACGVPIVSDWWEGLDGFFEPGREILIARSSDDVERALRDVPGAEREAIGARARARILAAHTSAHRASEFERFVTEARAARRR
jgi:spore maturation protein CgeB